MFTASWRESQERNRSSETLGPAPARHTCLAPASILARWLQRTQHPHLSDLTEEETEGQSVGGAPGFPSYPKSGLYLAEPKASSHSQQAQGVGK